MARAQCQWLQSGHQAVLKPASALASPTVGAQEASNLTGDTIVCV